MTGRRSNAGLRKKHALQLFKTDLCKFFLQSRCENGSRCSYAHTMDEVRRKPDLTRTSMCRITMQGGTCQDRTCRFAHNESELRATHGFFKMKMCGFAQSGRCKHGKNCRFAHTPDELRPRKPAPPNAEDNLLQPSQQQGLPEDGGADGSNSMVAWEAPGGNSSQARLSQDELVALQQQQQQGLWQFSTPPHGGAYQGQQYMQEQDVPDPPEPLPGAAEASWGRRAQWRQNRMDAAQAASEGAATPSPPMSSYGRGENSRGSQRCDDFMSTSCGPDAPSAESTSTIPRGSREAGASGPDRSDSDKSESADGSSWTSGGGGSSMTEVPRSDHTGTGSPPATSDSGSGNRRGAVHTAGHGHSSTSAGGTGNSGGSASASGSQGAGGEPQSRTRAHNHGVHRRPARGSAAPGNEASGGGGCKATTLLITNVPSYLTQGALLSMFEDLTYAMRGNFDFFYCPWDEKEGHNKGYALINFPDPAHAVAFSQSWTNKELFRGGRGQKALRVLKATTQGLQANLGQYAHMEIAQCQDPRFRPLYRDSSGMLLPLPLDPEDAALATATATEVVARPGSNGANAATSSSPQPDQDLAPLGEPPPAALQAQHDIAGPQVQHQQAQHQQAVDPQQAYFAGGESVPYPPAFSGQGRNSNMPVPQPSRMPRRGAMAHANQHLGLPKRQFQQRQLQHQQQQLLQQVPRNPTHAEDGADVAGAAGVQQAQQQPQQYAWPLMMVAQSWPMAADHHQAQMMHMRPNDVKMYPGGERMPNQDLCPMYPAPAGGGAPPDGLGGQTSQAAGADAAAGSSVGGPGAQQVLVPYMVMPMGMEAMIPVDNGYSGHGGLKEDGHVHPHRRGDGTTSASIVAQFEAARAKLAAGTWPTVNDTVYSD